MTEDDDGFSDNDDEALLQAAAEYQVYSGCTSCTPRLYELQKGAVPLWKAMKQYIAI